jgi:hypothetical protein
MKVNNASVRWNEGWLNHPQLILDVDRSEVNYDTMRYEQRGSIYYAEREDGSASLHSNGQKRY